MKKFLNVKIPEDFCFDSVSGLNNEAIEKLKHFKPNTLEMASKISGITPATIDILHIYIKMRYNLAV